MGKSFWLRMRGLRNLFGNCREVILTQKVRYCRRGNTGCREETGIRLLPGRNVVSSWHRRNGAIFLSLHRKGDAKEFNTRHKFGREDDQTVDRSIPNCQSPGDARSSWSAQNPHAKYLRDQHGKRALETPQGAPFLSLNPRPHG